MIQFLSLILIYVRRKINVNVQFGSMYIYIYILYLYELYIFEVQLDASHHFYECGYAYASDIGLEDTHVEVYIKKSKTDQCKVGPDVVLGTPEGEASAILSQYCVFY